MLSLVWAFFKRFALSSTDAPLPPLPSSLPAPLTRRYDSLDSATNGRSDIDSGSGSSRRTSRQYSLDSRHSLSDRWVSAPPLQLHLPSPAPACDSVSLWSQWWTCPVLLARCACMHALSPYLCICIFYTFYRKLLVLHLYLLFSRWKFANQYTKWCIILILAVVKLL